MWRWSQRIVRGSEAGNGQWQGGIGRGVASEVGGGGEVVFREAGAGRTARAAASAAVEEEKTKKQMLVDSLCQDHWIQRSIVGRSFHLVSFTRKSWTKIENTLQTQPDLFITMAAGTVFKTGLSRVLLQQQLRTLLKFFLKLFLKMSL